MTAGNRALKIAGAAAGVAVSMVGGAYAAQRALTRSLRRRPDPDAGRLGSPTVDETRHLASHDGGTLFTLSRGTGPPVVLSHGVTINSSVWVKQFETLPAAGLRAVAFDHRGHGRSVVGDSGHSLENLAWDVRTVLEELDLRDAVLVGHSMGGVAIQAFVARHPDIARERVRGIVLLSSLARSHLGGPRWLRGLVEQATGRAQLSHLMAHPDFGTMLARVGFGRSPLASWVELTRQMLAECDPRTTREAIGALMGLDLTPELVEIDLPALVIDGTADVLTPPFEARHLARHIPGARLVMLNGAGHMIMLERAREFDSLLVEFTRHVGALPAVAAS
jgi:pimeloyl-ACP methyl ester carboxylesterase